jgi:hypothetical protein
MMPWSRCIGSAFGPFLIADQMIGIVPAANGTARISIGFRMQHQFRFLVILFRQSERYRRLSVITKPIPRDGKEEHEAIFKATLARNAELASQLLASHIRLTYDGINNLPPEFFEESSLTVAEARSLS